MGGFEGIQGMINSLRENRKLLRRKGMFEKDKSIFDGNHEYPHGPKGKLINKKATPSQMRELRLQLEEQSRVEKLVTYGVILAILLLLSGVVYWMVTNIGEGNTYAEEIHASEQAEKQKHFQFCINQGDKWLRQNQWNNAIFQYREALKVFPNDFGALHRLAIAQTYKCKATQEDCEEASQLIDRLIKAKPENKDLIELRASYKYALNDSLGAVEDYGLLDDLE